MTAAILHAVLLAFGLILPLGPQNAFLLAQGAHHPTVRRAVPALVAAGLCDTLLILLAVGGVSLVVMQISWLKTALVVVGVAFLTVVGWLSWRAGNTDERITGDSQALAWSTRKQVLFTVSVSLGNPHAILDTVGVIGTSSLAYAGDEKTAFAVTCVAVSWAYFLTLVLAGRALAHAGIPKRLLNRASAVVMWVSAGYLVVSVV